jgi:hypothetical protein
LRVAPVPAYSKNGGGNKCDPAANLWSERFRLNFVTGDGSARYTLRTYFIISVIFFIVLTLYGLWNGLL